MSRSASALIASVLLTASPAEMLKRADAPHDAFPEGVIRLRVVVSERGKKPVESLMELFVKGSDTSLAVFLSGKQKDRKILTVGDRVWLIVPGASRPIPVSKSQRLMGAASFGDIAGLRFAGEYDATLRPEEETVPASESPTPCHVLDLKAKRKGAAFPSAVLWTGTEDGLARRLRLSLASGKQAKEVLFTGYGEKHRVKTMEIRDLLAKGAATVTSLEFESYDLKSLDPALFDPGKARTP